VARIGPVDLVPQLLPDAVMPAYTAPMNHSPDFVSLLDLPVGFPESSDSLGMIGEDGSVHHLTVGAGPRTLPGPIDGCGWRVTERGASLELEGDPGSAIAPNWLRIAYLASQASPVEISVDGRTRTEAVRSGLNELFLRSEADASTVTIDGLAAGTIVCIDTIEVGPQVLGPSW
jgi:hypothetical protein